MLRFSPSSRISRTIPQLESHVAPLPKYDEEKPRYSNEAIRKRFLRKLREMSTALAARANRTSSETTLASIRTADTTKDGLPANSIDLILTSPPYCTRIDYTAATRVELALLAPFIGVAVDELGRQMIGSTRVPAQLS